MKMLDCPLCGKTFIPQVGHKYRDKATRNLLCSYTCDRKAEKAYEKMKKEEKAAKKK